MPQPETYIPTELMRLRAENEELKAMRRYDADVIRKRDDYSDKLEAEIAEAKAEYIKQRFENERLQAHAKSNERLRALMKRIVRWEIDVDSQSQPAWDALMQAARAELDEGPT